MNGLGWATKGHEDFPSELGKFLGSEGGHLTPLDSPSPAPSLPLPLVVVLEHLQQLLNNFP